MESEDPDKTTYVFAWRRKPYLLTAGTLAPSDRCQMPGGNVFLLNKTKEHEQYGFHLHAKAYVAYSGSSDSIRFETVVGGLFRISIFSIGPKLF